MIINPIKHLDSKNDFVSKNNVSFKAASPPVYAVKSSGVIKRGLPTIAFLSSFVGALGYLIGASGLFYDIKKDAGEKTVKSKDGVETVEANTKFGKFGINAAKIAVAATGAAGIACGLGEGLPLMALGETAVLGSSSIINTPTGTGLFGIGIASIFAGLALENTPELKLNQFALMSEKSSTKKAQMVLKNMGVVVKEITSSVFQIVKNIYKPKFIKENILQGTPKTVVFREEVNKDGKIIFSKMLRHNKNYVMNAASFVLALGGAGLAISSVFDAKKAQKISLKAEEGGFLFDNFGMTRYGLDKLTTGGNGKAAGLSFAIGGVINAVSQFMGIDNKDGRALQWLGISGVFLGFSIDRGKHLRQALKEAKQRPELTQVVREWKFNLSNLVKDKTELKKLLKDIKTDQPITDKRFIDFENKFKNTIGIEFKTTEHLKKELEKRLGQETFSHVRSQEIGNFEKSKEILNICTEKIFGSKNPTPIN